jgi:uncharacterized RDD family membrane protein YckC
VIGRDRLPQYAQSQPTALGPQYAQPHPGQPAPYGQNPADQYAPWSGGPPGFTRPQVTYASWGARAVALLLDWLFALLAYIPAIVCWILVAATADTSTDANGDTSIDNVNGGLIALGIVLSIAGFAFTIWSLGFRQGIQGWSYGKQIIGIKLVAEATAVPPGGGIGIGRMLLRGFLGSITGGIYTILTYLWPLWDEKNQTLDDKIWSTLVIRVR